MNRKTFLFAFCSFPAPVVVIVGDVAWMLE